MVGFAAYSIACNVGRLVEVRLSAVRTVLDVASLEEERRQVFSRMDGKCIFCADWRQMSLLSPDVADALVELFRRGNQHIERSGVLLPSDAALLQLQVARVVREAANETRRTFLLAREMRAWLGEVLDEAERRRMDEFIVDEVT
jgi:hypothetical protein